MIDVNNELRLMNDFHLTAEELLFIELLFYYKEGEEVEGMSLFCSQLKAVPTPELLQSLMSKKVLLKEDIGKGMKLSDYNFTKFFLHRYHQYSPEWGMELFYAYPPELSNGQSYFKTKNISKRFNSLEDFCYFYAKQIKFKEEKHEEVMEILRWAIENNRLFYGIVEFVVSHKWEELALEKENGVTGFINTMEFI